MEGKCKRISLMRDQWIKFEECESSAHVFDTQKIVKQFKRRSIAIKCVVWESCVMDLFIPLGPL